MSSVETLSSLHYQKPDISAAFAANTKTCNISNHSPSVHVRLPMQSPKPPDSHPGMLMTIMPPPKFNSTVNDYDWKMRKNKKKKSSTNPATSTTTDVLCLMDGLGLSIPLDIYASLIKECTDAGDAAQATELHAHIKRSSVPLGLPLLNRILLMYVSCGLIQAARQMFDEMTVLRNNSNSWAIMVAAYMDDGFYEEVISLFVKMLQHHSSIMLLLPTWVLICILKACVHTMDMTLGKQVHGWLLKVGYVANLFISSSLINFYGKFRCLEDANSVFDQTSKRDTVIWTAKIVNSCREEHVGEVLNAFTEMGRVGIKRNKFTFSSVLKACGRMKDHGHFGRLVHACSIKLGLESDIYVRCGLIDMYGKFELLRDARMVFETVRDANRTSIVCWNAMLTGYVRNGLYIEAIKFLYQMKAAGIQPQETLVSEIRIACGSREF